MTDLVELCLVTDGTYSEQAEDVLFASGASSVTIESAGDESRFDNAAPGHAGWKHQRIRALFDENRLVPELLQHVESEMRGIPGAHALTTRKLEDRDWETAWQDRFHPFEVGQRLLVSPTWCAPDCGGRTTVWIDPGLAFGTGTHETTRLCLEYLDSMDLKGKSVIDFGCGSGILGIAASKLGASEVVGIDIDPRAVETANRNGEINRVPDSFRAQSVERFLRQRQALRADVVIANILAGTLVDLSDRISPLVHEKGILMLSGILTCQADTVVSAYEHSFRFNCLNAADWVLLIGENTDG